MHAPPAVQYAVGRSQVHGRVLAAVLMLGLLTGASWLRHGAGPDWRQGVFLLFYLVGAGLAIRQWWRAPDGLLRWDGRNWRWSGWPVAAGLLQVRLDGQSWMLLSLRRAGAGTLWLWLERGTDPLAWPALRRAVYAPAGGAAERPDVGPEP